MSQIIYPTDFPGGIKLFYLMKAKHDADFATPDGSVLTSYLAEQGIDLAADKMDVDQAAQFDDQFNAKEKEEEELREHRDKVFEPRWEILREMVQDLKNFKRGKVHERGAWGVTVDGDNRIVYPSDFK